MVGVQGGSKGCTRCRKRKVKCDETRPICRRCAKAGLECGGFPDIFQHDARSSVRRSQPNNASEADQGKQDDQPAASFPTQASSDVVKPMFSTNWIPDSLNLHSFDDTMCVAYTNYNLLKGAVRVKEVKHPFVIPGLSSFNKDSLTRNCILALSFTFFGQQHSSTTITRKGTSLYGSSLTELNRLLRDPVESRTMETFEAIMVMTLYELLSGAKTSGWVSHCLGLETLYKMYGPRLFAKSPTTIAFFENTRPMIVNACMLSLKSCVLAAPEWKTLPWSGGFGGKSDYQLLFDIYCDIPGITLYMQDPLLSGLRMRPEFAGDPDTIYLKAASLLEQLDKWARYWFNKNRENIWEAYPSYTPPNWTGAQEDLAWNTVLHFRELYTAQSYANYYSALLILLQTMDNFEQSGLLTVEHPRISRYPQIYQAAIDICRVIDYHLLDTQNGAGSLFILTPARCAWKVLGEDSNEGKWMMAVMMAIGRGQRGRWAIAAGTLRHYDTRELVGGTSILGPSGRHRPVTIDLG